MFFYVYFFRGNKNYISTIFFYHLILLWRLLLLPRLASLFNSRKLKWQKKNFERGDIPNWIKSFQLFTIKNFLVQKKKKFCAEINNKLKKIFL